MPNRTLVPGEGPWPCRCSNVQTGNGHHRDCCSRRATSQLCIVNSKISGQSLTIPLIKPARNTTFDELLDIGSVAANQPRERGIILFAFPDEALEHLSLVNLAHGHFIAYVNA